MVWPFLLFSFFSLANLPDHSLQSSPHAMSSSYTILHTYRYSPVFKKVAEGVACLRNAWRSGALRMAMFDWRSEVTFQANWEYAIKYAWSVHVAVVSFL